MRYLTFLMSFFRNIRYQKHIPKMMYQFKGKSGKVIPKTRVSNATFIDNIANFDLAENVYIGHFNFIEASNGLTIEEGCQITNFITITTHSSHQSIRLYGKNYGNEAMKGYLKGSVYIGKYSFIGPHCTIMPNTNIGKGCLIAAYSYVQGNFPDFSIIAGNPAKVVGNTQTKDFEILSKHPELTPYYNEWAKE